MYITAQHIDNADSPQMPAAVTTKPETELTDGDQIEQAKRYFTELTRNDYSNGATDTHYIHFVDGEARYSFPCLKDVDLVYVSRADDSQVEFVTVEVEG